MLLTLRLWEGGGGSMPLISASRDFIHNGKPMDKNMSTNNSLPKKYSLIPFIGLDCPFQSSMILHQFFEKINENK